VRLGEALEPVRGELRPGLTTDAVGMRILDVILDRLSRHRGTEADLRDWLAAWVLPGLVTDPPPLPERFTEGAP
jgi:hypothetical protein